jgi:hypothetical protein
MLSKIKGKLKGIIIIGGYFSNVIYAYFASLGLKITAENVSNKGKIDPTIKLNDNLYILEFKIDGQGTALGQIKDKNYHQNIKAKVTISI